ncbi:hypothetical protein, partial [uncultured Aquitalea sp.]
GPSARKGVEVRVFSWAPFKKAVDDVSGFFSFLSQIYTSQAISVSKGLQWRCLQEIAGRRPLRPTSPSSLSR